MRTLIKMSAVTLGVLLLSFSAQARDADQSFLMLREAIMESNGDYNKFKKKMNEEEFDREASWSNRSANSIDINQVHLSENDRKEFEMINNEDE